MIYLSRFRRAENRERETEETYPFSVPAVQALSRSPLLFDREITLLCGGNGSGKSTLMELIGAKMDAVRIGQGIIERSGEAAKAQDAFVLEKRALPKRNFFFSAEDFIAYIAWVSRAKQEAREELARIDADDSIPDKNYARMPWAGTLEDLDGLYAGDLACQSHGEGFLDFFRSRLKPGGAYLLDEPEGALSYENQYALALIMQDAVRADKCQFILATHSPVLTALPDARLYRLTDEGFATCQYGELPDVSFLKLFLERHERMLNE